MFSDRVIFRLKALASIALISAILWNANWSEVWASLKVANILLCAMVLAILVVMVFISAWKWQWLLGMHRVGYTFGTLSRWYFIAAFLNNFLPSSIGGDGYRIYCTLDNSRSRSTAVVGVLADRLTGIVTLLGMGWLASGVSAFATGNSFSTMVFQGGCAGLVGLLAVLLIFRLTGVMSKFLRLNWLQKKLRPLGEHLQDYRQQPMDGIGALMISVIFHTLNILALWLLLRALDANISVFELTVVVASVGVVSILPISINGFGLVDGAYVLLLGLYGIDHAHGVGFSILLRCLVIPISLTGMVLYLWKERGDGKRAVPHNKVSI